MNDEDQASLRRILNSGCRDEQGRFRSKDWQFERIVALADEMVLQAKIAEHTSIRRRDQFIASGIASLCMVIVAGYLWFRALG